MYKLLSIQNFISISFSAIAEKYLKKKVASVETNQDDKYFIELYL